LPVGGFFDTLKGGLTALILVFCGQTATDVSLTLVFVQYFSDLTIQPLVALWQPNLKVFVNGGFGNPKVACGGAYSGSVFNHVHSQFAGSVFNGI
jgi:hypothetical protein